MTTRKITAFLMCPAANGDASGGTPAASAASGGHIKKGAWVTAHDAALVGLAQVIPGPLSRALPYCYENKADECVDGKEGPEKVGVHGRFLDVHAKLAQHLGNDEQRNRPVPAAGKRRGEGNAQDEEAKVSHRSVLGFAGEAPCDMNGGSNVVLRHLDSDPARTVDDLAASHQATFDQLLDRAIAWLWPRRPTRIGLPDTPPLVANKPLLQRREFGEVVVHGGSVLALIAPLLIHGALQAGVSDGDEKEQHTDASHQGADDAQQVEKEVAHGSGPDGCQPSFKEQCEFQHTHALERGRQNDERRNHDSPRGDGRRAQPIRSRHLEKPERTALTNRDSGRGDPGACCERPRPGSSNGAAAVSQGRAAGSGESWQCEAIRGATGPLAHASAVRAAHSWKRHSLSCFCSAYRLFRAAISSSVSAFTRLAIRMNSRRSSAVRRIGFISGLGLLLGAQALQLAVACLRQHNQFLTERESRFGGCPLQKIADGHLAATADLRDLGLAKTALLNA